MRYDVFLSYRGGDIRKTFLSHLVHSLDRKGIISVTSPENYLSEATIARESRVAIFIISKSYTSFDLWVAQLAEMLSYKMGAVPVFLRVDPLDVLRDLNLAKPRWSHLVIDWLDGHVTKKSGFRSADWEDESQLVDKITCFVSDSMKLQDSTSGEDKDLSLNWVGGPELDSTRRNYMHGRSLGHHHHSLALEPLSVQEARRPTPLLHSSELSRTPEEEDIRDKSFVHNIGPSATINKSSWWGQLKKKINLFVKHTRPSETIESSTTTYQVISGEYLPGMKHHVEEVLRMLRGDSMKEVRTIGICGGEGVGKTTLAKFVYEEISPQFQHHFFIKHFSKHGTSLSEIFASETLLEATTSFNERSRDVMRDMVGRKVLFVADSVDDTEHLKCLAKEVSLFGPGSRVILITSERSLLIQCGVKHIYEVGCLKYEEAIQLFSYFAYEPSDTLPRSHGLISRAVEVAGCIPLGLKLLGSFLYGKDDFQWENTLRVLEASHKKYSEEAFKYIGAYDFKPSGTTILELEEDEANRYPLYSFSL